MFFHVARSILEFTFDQLTFQFQFSLFHFNKGKDKFKKRYELSFDGSKYDEQKIIIEEVAYLPFGCPVIVCICNQKESTNYDVYLLLFETKEVQLFLSFSYTGYYKNLCIDYGPTISCTIGSIEYTTSVYDNDEFLSPKSYDYRKAIILEEDNVISISNGEIHLTIPKSSFPSSSILYCLEIKEGFILLSTNFVSLTISIFVNHVIYPLIEVEDELLSIQQLPFYTYCYSIQLQKECIFLHNQLILARIKGDLVFMDDFMNSGFPQFCSISTSSYSLYSNKQHLIQTNSFHTHSHHQSSSSTLTSSQRNLFFQGLFEQQQRLDEEIHQLQADHSILSQLVTKGSVPIHSLHPLVPSELVKQSELSEQVQESEQSESISLQASLSVINPTTLLLLIHCSFSPSSFFLFTHQHSLQVSLFQADGYIGCWLPSTMRNSDLYVYTEVNDKRISIQPLALNTLPVVEYNDLACICYSFRHEDYDGYFSPSIQYRLIHESYSQAIMEYDKRDGRLVLFATKQVRDLIEQTVSALLNEIAGLKEEMNTVKVNGFYRMKRKCLERRTLSDQLVCKLAFFIGQSKEITNWKEFLL